MAADLLRDRAWCAVVLPIAPAFKPSEPPAILTNERLILGLGWLNQRHVDPKSVQSP